MPRRSFPGALVGLGCCGLVLGVTPLGCNDEGSASQAASAGASGNGGDRGSDGGASAAGAAGADGSVPAAETMAGGGVGGVGGASQQPEGGGAGEAAGNGGVPGDEPTVEPPVGCEAYANEALEKNAVVAKVVNKRATTVWLRAPQGSCSFDASVTEAGSDRVLQWKRVSDAFSCTKNLNDGTCPGVTACINLLIGLPPNGSLELRWYGNDGEVLKFVEPCTPAPSCTSSCQRERHAAAGQYKFELSGKIFGSCTGSGCSSCTGNACYVVDSNLLALSDPITLPAGTGFSFPDVLAQAGGVLTFNIE